MMYSYDMHEFYSDWMDDFIDAQDKTTGFCHTQYHVRTAVVVRPGAVL